MGTGPTSDRSGQEGQEAKEQVRKGANEVRSRLDLFMPVFRSLLKKSDALGVYGNCEFPEDVTSHFEVNT